MLRPTVGSGLVISWAGMRDIVSLAAAMALPPAFPYRDLVVLTAFAVVLGTLVIQGLTLKPLLVALNLRDEDPVGREVTAARERALHAALASFADDRSPVAQLVRKELTARLSSERADADASAGSHAAYGAMHGAALRAARQAILAMRASDEIGDDAFHQIKRSWTGSKWQPVRGKSIRRAGCHRLRDRFSGRTGESARRPGREAPRIFVTNIGSGTPGIQGNP